MSGSRCLGLLALLTAVAPVARAQTARGELGRFEVWGLDYRPDGAWRRRAQAVRDARQALFRAGRLHDLNLAREAQVRLAGAGTASPFVLSGAVFTPVVLIAYADVPVAFPSTAFQDVLFSSTPLAIGQPYSLKTYYEELSSGLIDLHGVVFGPVRVGRNAAFYQDNCNGIGVLTTCPNQLQPFRELLLAVLDSVSMAPGGDTLWNQFDNDGPDGIPNSGDDDGYVDFVTFLQPTSDGACNGSAGIWAHRWQIAALNGGQAYVTSTPRRDAAGNPIPGEFLRINEYTIQSQVGGATGCSPTAIMPIGTVAHETGHAFGLPDLYDTDPISRTQGIGHWGLMGSGNYATPMSPASYEAWSLAELGWVALVELARDTVITTGARQVSDTVFVVRTDHPAQYFLLENRQAVLSDSAQMGPDFSPRKAPGLLVWLIDEQRILAGRSSNRVNTGAIQGVALMQADGQNDLRRPGSLNRGDEGDSWPGATANTRFGFSTNPSARQNNGVFAGFLIDRIEHLADGDMRYRFTRREPTLITPSATGPVIHVNGQEAGRYEEVVPAGDTLVLAVDTMQDLPGGRSRARFLHWSLGGDADQIVVSGPAPDTVIAHFALSHQLVAVSQGGGAFSASITGDLAGGLFLDEGTPVTLTATAPDGFDFVLWQGDTATVHPELRLAMSRPYEVSAVFIETQIIPLDDAVAELLGTPRLSSDQRTWLDQLGNRNGAFDVGDYLAYLHRTGGVADASLLARLHPRPRRD